eukprot:TRINITY_DN345_c0_g1_i1.p1 TRINITY_DN345_c0_g1~~TRINITY_DN345_c0_g1_i1.p1  ORF type:complete len:325 (+),score=55.36 TRINITY_DN345_c0_g1_i1:84-1058(+)
MNGALALFFALSLVLTAASDENNASVTSTVTSTMTTTASTTKTKTILTRTVVDVQGQSGKFTVYDERSGKASGIQVTMDALREVDAAGNAVGASGSVKHSINTFAAQAFTIAPAEDVMLGNVSAVKVSFSSPITSIGVISVDTYVLGKSGSLGPPGETWAVQNGDLKWNIALSNWQWCGCSQGGKTEEGAFIDVDISVKGLGNAETKGKSNKSLTLGGGVTLELSNQVHSDGKWSAMPAGYPKVSMQGSSTTFTFRFPRFTESSVYDPVLTGLAASGDSTSVSPTTTQGPTTTGPGISIDRAADLGGSHVMIAVVMVMTAMWIA